MSCERDAACRVIDHNDAPNFRTISDFRKLHLAELEGLFVQVLRLCREAGLVKLDHVSRDDTKIKASASRHKAMSYGRMKEEEKRLRTEVRDLLNRAEVTDAEEDERYGRSRRGDELPEALSRRKDRLKKMRDARKTLENKAKAAAAEDRKRRAEEDRRRNDKPCPGRKRQAVKEVPDDKKQYNFSDPETLIMKAGNKGFDQCGDAQAAVDRAHQVVVAADVTSEPNDKKQLKPMVRQAKKNISRGQYADKFSADSGYFSEDNVTWIEGQSIDAYIATGRLKHTEQMPAHPRGRPPIGLTAKARMARKLRTKKGRKTPVV